MLMFNRIERRPIDPPPIIQLKIKDDRQDPCHNYLQSPHLFVCVDLYAANESSSLQVNINNALAGTSVSSLYRLKDIDNSDGGFFVFGDLSVRIEGQFRLRFYLFEVQKFNIMIAKLSCRADVCFLQSITSDVFQVYSAKQFPGMLDSTFLSRSFSDQGVRIRIRKEHRIKMKRQPQRALLSPEQPPQYLMADQRPSSSQFPPPYPSEATNYDSRTHADYHYAGAPIRSHAPRQADYHPYQRGQHPPGGYVDRPPYSEMMPSNFHGSPPYRAMVPGTQAVSEYTLHPSYGRPLPSHSQGEGYYYPPDQRRAAPPQPPSPYPTYSDRRVRIYPEQNPRDYPSERSPYPVPYPDQPPKARYSSESRPPTSQHSGHPPPYYTPPPQSMRRSPQELNPRGGPYYYQETSISSHGTAVRAEVSQHSEHASSNTHYSSERRESRHSINAILSEEGRRSSPLSSRPGSETSSSMGRSVSMGQGDPPDRDIMEDVNASVRLPPLRQGSSGENKNDGEPPQPRSNSNLWKLVSVATEQ